jgi:hypothetical protein
LAETESSKEVVDGGESSRKSIAGDKVVQETPKEIV